MKKLLTWCKNHFVGLIITLIVIGTFLGSFCGFIIASNDDAPGAIFILAFIGLVVSSIVGASLLALYQQLQDIEQKLK